MEKKGNVTEQIVSLLVARSALAKKEIPGIQRGFSQAEHEQFDAFLVDEGIVDATVLLGVLSDIYQVPSYDVTHYFFDTQLLRMFPKGFLLRNKVIPLQRDENMLMVVASEPEREGLESALREFVSYDINFYVGMARDICDAIKEFYDKSLSDIPGDDQLLQERIERIAERRIEDLSDDNDE